MKPRLQVAVLAGDGIGPEIMAQALRVLDRLNTQFTLGIAVSEGSIGGAAFDQYGEHFPETTRALCHESSAILFGSVGGPPAESHLEKWHKCEINSILALRKEFGLATNLRPTRVYPILSHLSPLRADVIGSGIDLLIVRELLGDLYFGEHSFGTHGGRRVARDHCDYSEDQIATAARTAFEVARTRRCHVTSVDKANVLHTSKLWREVVHEVHRDYSDVTLVDMLVDNCALQLVRSPGQFDVILTSNLFGDILSDLASALPGSLGVAPSASLASGRFGLYEPSGGSAPDIAGQGLANPIGQILSVGMMLRLSLGLDTAARALESAVQQALEDGFRTTDIFNGDGVLVTTEGMGNAILERIR